MGTIGIYNSSTGTTYSVTIDIVTANAVAGGDPSADLQKFFVTMRTGARDTNGRAIPTMMIEDTAFEIASDSATLTEVIKARLLVMFDEILNPTSSSSQSSLSSVSSVSSKSSSDSSLSSSSRSSVSSRSSLSSSRSSVSSRSSLSSLSSLSSVSSVSSSSVSSVSSLSSLSSVSSLSSESSTATKAFTTTGSNSPNVNGLYYTNGTYNSQTAYERKDHAMWIWYDTGSSSYVISATKGDQTAAFVNGVITNVAGSYTAVGTATGTATVA